MEEEIKTDEVEQARDEEGRLVIPLEEEKIEEPKEDPEILDYPETPAVNPEHDYQVSPKVYVDGLDGANVKLTGNQTIAGVKTFGSIPVLPASDPTADNQATRKIFIDKSRITYASDVLRESDDEENYSSISSYTKVKEIEITSRGGIIRVKFDLKHSGVGGGTAYGKIYVNGVARGTERINAGTTYATHSEDINVNNGDWVQLYVKRQTDGAAYYRNFRLHWDYSTKVYVDVENTKYMGKTTGTPIGQEDATYTNITHGLSVAPRLIVVRCLGTLSMSFGSARTNGAKVINDQQCSYLRAAATVYTSLADKIAMASGNGANVVTATIDAITATTFAIKFLADGFSGAACTPIFDWEAYR